MSCLAMNDKGALEKYFNFFKSTIKENDLLNKLM